MIRYPTYPTLVLVCTQLATVSGLSQVTQDIEITQQIAEALLDCALEDASQWPGPVVIAPANQYDYDWAVALSLPIRSPVTILPQIPGNSVGKQLNMLDQELRDKGTSQVVFIGSDAPELSTKDYLNVIDALQYFDTALKPIKNAGVALMASNNAWPDLSTLPWGTSRLNISLSEACRNANHSFIKLEPACNIDELDGFVKLIMLLEKDKRPARQALLQMINEMVSVTQMVHTIN